MNPYPVAYFTLDNIVYKVYEVDYEVSDRFENKEIGAIVIQDKSNLVIKASDGLIYLKKIMLFYKTILEILRLKIVGLYQKRQNFL